MTLESRCQDAAKRLEDTDFLRIVSDDDADGIAAAGVLTQALERVQLPFHLTLDRLHVDEYDELKAHDAVALLDQGAGELSELAEHPGTVVVLDHHQIEGRAPHALHVNPHLEGIDGTHDACTSAIAWMVAQNLEPETLELAPVAVAGMVGDRQHVPELGPNNQGLVDSAVEAGELAVERGLALDPHAPLDEALATSVDPYLEGVGGRASKAGAFLEELGLSPRATLSEISDDEERRLTSAIVAHLVEQDAEPSAIEQVAGQRYTGRVAGHRVTASELSAMFNACEREDEASLGVAIAHGDESAFVQAQRHVEAYQDSLLEGLVKLEANPPEKREAIQVFDAVDPELVGAHCGLGMSYIFDQDRPTFGLKTSNGNLKVSGRATPQLVDAGLNLGDALAEAADEHGGNGGGHPIAAGAMIPLANREAFVETVDELVEAQLRG